MKAVNSGQKRLEGDGGGSDDDDDDGGDSDGDEHTANAVVGNGS